MSKLFPLLLALQAHVAAAAAPAQGGYLAGELGSLDSGATATAQAMQAPSLLPTLLNVVFSLALVVGLILAAYWLLLKWRAAQGLAPGSRVGLIRVLERQYIDAKRGIAVVEVGDSVLTLGLGEDVTLLAEEADTEAVERLRRMAPAPAGVMGFKEQLRKVGLSLKREEWGRIRDDLKGTGGEIKTQSERIRGPKGGPR